MIQRILFPTDFSACAERAYRHAAYLADRFGAELHVLHVVENEAAPERAWPDTLGGVQITLADVYADLGLPLPTERADIDPVDLIEVVETEVVGRKAAPTILDVAYDEEVDLIVMGTHGRTGWRRGVIGSVAEAVTRRAPCPVLTVRPTDAADGPWPPTRVLVAVDVDQQLDETPAAALWAARLAEAYHATLDLLHVTEPVVLGLDGPAEAAQARTLARHDLLDLAGALRDAMPRLPVHAVVRTGEAAPTIRAVVAEAGTHLVVVGTRGRRGAERALLGSVAEAVVRTAPCPVLVVRDALDADLRVPEADGADLATEPEAS